MIKQLDKQIGKPIPCTKEPNCQGWESLVSKWQSFGWPRRPAQSEIAKMIPLISGLNGDPIGIFGATPEYRAALAKYKSNNEVFLFEKSAVSYKGMTQILKTDFGVSPKKEHMVDIDWEYLDFAKNEFSLLMGDIFTGYFQTKDRLNEFLANSNMMLKKGGKLIIRDFVNIPFKADAKDIRHSKMSTDEKRWAYILTPKFAIEGETFFEAKLADNLLSKVHDIKVFKTCADPPRERLILKPSEFEAMLSKHFDVQVISPPSTNGKPTPGIWVLEKN